MNKRIKKKRLRLSPLDIGDHTYTPEEIKYFVNRSLLRDWLIPRMWAASLDTDDESAHVWRRKDIKRSLSYMYKHRKIYLSYKHLKFARHLNPKDEFILQKPPAIISEHRTIPSGVMSG